MSSSENKSAVVEEYLTFDKVTQEAIVGWMLADYGFFLNCKSNIDFTYFVDPHVSDLVRLIYQIAETYGRQPKRGDVETMLNVNNYGAEGAKEKFAALARCMISKESKSLDILAKEMTSWKRLIILRKAQLTAQDLYNKRRYSETAGWLKAELAKIEKASFEKDEKVRFDDLLEFYNGRDRDSHRNRCTLGHPYFDELVYTGSAKPVSEWKPGDIASHTKGSLVPGSTTMLIGPSNAGKTTTVATILFHNLLFDRKVLLITLEEKWEDMKHYIVQSLSGVEAFKLNDVAHNEDLKKKLVGVSKLTQDRLVYIDGVRLGKMFIEDIASIVEIEQEKMKGLRSMERQALRTRLRKEGKLDSATEEELLIQDQENRGFDLVIVDYPGKLKAKSLGRNSSLHEEQAYVYNKFVELALIHRFHAILPVQTNREGYKAANRKDGKEAEIVDQAHIANSFGIAQVASNVITINRGPEDIKNNRIKFYIAKTRTAPATGCFVSKTDFARRRSFGIFGLNGGKINPGEAITDQSVCQALGEAAMNASQTALPLLGMPSGKEAKFEEYPEVTGSENIIQMYKSQVPENNE